MLSRENDLHYKDFTGLKLCEDTTERQDFGGQKTGGLMLLEKSAFQSVFSLLKSVQKKVQGGPFMLSFLNRLIADKKGL